MFVLIRHSKSVTQIRWQVDWTLPLHILEKSQRKEKKKMSKKKERVYEQIGYIHKCAYVYLSIYHVILAYKQSNGWVVRTEDYSQYSFCSWLD